MLDEVTVEGDGQRHSYTLPIHEPGPGETCQVCHRRVNKPRTEKSPPTKVKSFRLEADRADNLWEGLKALADVTGATKKSYPIGTLLEALLLLGGQNREALGRLFDE